MCTSTLVDQGGVVNRSTLRLDAGPVRVHVVGVGGAGMSAIAAVLAAMGHQVTGSDVKDAPILDRLRRLGVGVAVGHDAAHVADCDVVTVSTAVPSTNPEVAAARQAGVPVLHRSEMLAAIASLRRCLAVSGTHGKTTTASMVALALVEAGLRPSFLIGGDVNEIGTNAVWDTGEWLVVEADESDGTFLALAPEIAVVTNVEADHLDHYGSFDALRQAFGSFLAGAAATVVGGDDPVAAELGRDLASAGVVVVSGLALGIDGAAHAGALDAGRRAAPPVGVAATGLDVAYPAVHRQLWNAVAARGAVVSEAPLGAPPRRGRFPARNRIVAGVCDVVVVVECHQRGGSIYTAEAAARRSIPVGVVPGSVRSPASAGTNALLVDGCFPVRDAEDVLVAVSLARRRVDRPDPLPVAGVPVAARVRPPRDDQRRPRGASAPPAPLAPPAPADGTAEAMVLAALDRVPTPIETVAVRTSLRVGELAQALHRLVAAGWADAGDGWWSSRYPLPGQRRPERRPVDG